MCTLRHYVLYVNAASTYYHVGIYMPGRPCMYLGISATKQEPLVLEVIGPGPQVLLD